ncbi:AAA family ATPase [Thiorhodococcus fuscus]|uniref:AAA family ATPase n=1 Tax=Thiorhodococcus fuscus TaxID=527200 RepID=A0ABW4YCB9_9GAMM
MRILRIRFKNLNSLTGAWDIDLTHPSYGADGIFAITGPTGAGKTTIFDAICLALYARTPRLNRIGKGANDIMSRRTGDCFAEATFETQSGRYRCHWSQHRARRKPDGELQNPKHELADADSGEILESQLRGVTERIESLTGMDFDRFTRSMLLAQGAFDTFLRAAPDDRAPILEQITGTEIYSRISIRTHERNREEHKRLETLNAELAGMTPLSEDQERESRERLSHLQARDADMSARLDQSRQAILWLDEIARLERASASIAERWKDLGVREEAFAPERQRLDRANRALELAADHAGLNGLRDQLEQDRRALTEDRSALPAREQALTQARQVLSQAESALTERRAEHARMTPILNEARTLDARLAEKDGPIATASKSLAERQAALAALRAQQERDALDSERRDLDSRLERLAETKADARRGALQSIEDVLGQKRDQLDTLLGQRAIADWRNDGEALQARSRWLDELSETARMLLETQRALKTLTDRQMALTRDEGETATEMRTASEKADALEREQHLIETQLILVRRIDSLEAQRRQLADGEPCPLCGATHHPYAEGNLPQREEAASQLERVRIESKQIDERIMRLKVKRAEIAKELDLIAGRHAEFLQRIAERETRIAELQSRLEIAETDLDRLIAEIPRLKETTQTDLARSTEVLAQIEALEREIRFHKAMLETARACIMAIEQSEQLEALQAERDALAEQRQTLLPDADPDTEGRRLDETVRSAQAARDAAHLSQNASARDLDLLRSRITALAQAIAVRTERAQISEDAFVARLLKAGFSDEPDYVAARLNEEERAAIAERAEGLARERTELNAHERETTTRLATERQRALTDRSRADLEETVTRLDTERNALHQEIGGLGQRLGDNAQLKTRQRERLDALAAQRIECARWDRLHQLIGSADGKKYRNFAQGLTFDIMIGHANRQLERMNDRYLLIRNQTQPLELDVIDKDQAGEIRSTKNLSGGESFIVSLALALGLSQMASQTVRVDSLFLDEGFGTLDSEALETALETLAGLRRDGKLIGIISHVPALKERIGTQIRVTPIRGGRSRIQGPGCREAS